MKLPRAHPRSRGENSPASGTALRASGSSPLTRGKRSGRVAMPKRHRLIPAHAGKTPCGRTIARRCTAHPRSRGENGGGRPSGPEAQGLIPAHAGKTTLSNLTSSLTRAHPRSRGENSSTDAIAASVSGSSPLTRGKLSGLCLGRFGPGLIPAHAGKTSSLRRRSRTRRAHPRSRGENGKPTWPAGWNPGSSPLTRGKLGYRAPLVATDGLIPAHAGKTLSSVSLRCPPRAHPRSRGEN